ncbi:NAD(P)H-flavin reductase [Pseudosporangium ferrugineum]|uniref:NAD(P)H-flavin reductase n=2 Tax=Pseudosporangium ferrugineum TaxID=439699 RepID=A0A2T0S8X7_9ACTN|nr:NAD(P)H-flavin reductase [Pseudosporangium ferrugineum]
MLALLRAMRLRAAAPEAVAAGEADTAAALSGDAAPTSGDAAPTSGDAAARSGDAAAGGGSGGKGPDAAVHPEALLHPDWPAKREQDATRPEVLPPPARPALPPAPPARELPAPQPEPALPADLHPGRLMDLLPEAFGSPAVVPKPAATPPPRSAPPATNAPSYPRGVPARAQADSPAVRRDVPIRPPVIPYPPGPGPWGGRHPGSSTDPVPVIPGLVGPRLVGPPWPSDPIQPVTPAPPVRPPVPPAPVDGMDPADDAALQEIRRLLGNSLSMAGGPQEVAVRLRAALVQAEPGLFATIPGDAAAQAEQLAEGLTWLVHTIDRPPALVAGFGRLGAALAECGVAPQQLQLTGAALAEAMRAGLAANGWRQDFDQAWRSTWQHAYEWIAHGMVAAAYDPVTWTAVVVAHERRRDDLAVVRLRPYLPMPYVPGQYARIEVPGLPGVWRPYSLAGAPRRDNVIELHVRAKTLTGVSGTLVHRTAVGDKVRISRAEGAMTLPASGRDLLLIAGDTGVAPLKAILRELAETGDPRSAVLFWGVRTLAELYDIEEIAAIAQAARRVTVVPVISEGEAGPYASGLVTDAVAAYGEWSEHEVYLAGPPLMLAATSAALHELGVAPGRIHHDAPE